MTARLETELFDELLSQQSDAWSVAKRDAFARICEAFPGPHGPGPEGLRQLRRGGFDARVPRPWRPVFVEVYQQWLGFAAEQEAHRPAPLLSPGWWLETQGPLRSLPRWLWPLLSPGAVLAAGLLVSGALAARDVRARADAATRLRSVMSTTTLADDDLADAERLALAALAGGSDAVLESYLAAEGSLRSRFDAARREHERLDDTLAALAGLE